MRRLLTATFALSLLLLASGCDSVIERTEPSTAIDQDRVLSTPSAINGVRASMYDRMHSEELSTDWLLGPAAMADNTFFRGNQERHQGLNRNQLREGLGTLGDRSAYNDLYFLINDANLLINAIGEGVLDTDVQNKYTAEALFMRSLAHHHAARIWGYDPATPGGDVVSPNSGQGQGFDLGVILQTQPTTALGDVDEPARATVGEVYDQLEDDLGRAIDLFSNLPADLREGSEFYPSEAAAQALLARVHLYQRNWEAADDAAQAAINLAGASFGSGLAAPDAVGDIFDENGSNPEAIFTIDTSPTTSSDVISRVNESISAYTSQQWIAQLPTQDLISLYDTGDTRLDAWYGECFNELDGRAPEGCDQINDPGLELQKYTSEQSVSQFVDDYIHLRIAEMVLIQAEARLNTDGVGPAIARLNDLRMERNASMLTPGNYNTDSAYDEILNERRRELVAEGHRFFDLKRLGRDIRKVQGQDDVPFNDLRILDDLPPDQVAVNPQLQQNPGYAD